ncbi:hypothetical protein GCM10010305_59500 [Streptomyces termitum]|uniref:Uncharacterized protein n=1 Tax=Streptomyces termitum TaxID=67368 RepID=A0A918WDP5_9ACTN|nr:hypothetical protein GCM10010305_59500 [Streptomyces termitum]
MHHADDPTPPPARKAARDAGRDPDALTICVAAPAYVGDDPAHARDQCRWFGGTVGNHVADLVAKYGEHSDMVPEELTAYIKGRRLKALGVDQFSVYAMHDDREGTIDVYGTHVIPSFH